MALNERIRIDQSELCGTRTSESLPSVAMLPASVLTAVGP
jgi:hypothetical protein